MLQSTSEGQHEAVTVMLVQMQIRLRILTYIARQDTYTDLGHLDSIFLCSVCSCLQTSVQPKQAEVPVIVPP